MDYDKVTDLDTQELTIVKKPNPNKSPSLHIYWRCTEIADYSEIAKDNIIIAFYVFYHPFVSSWWVFSAMEHTDQIYPTKWKENKKKHLMQLCCLIQCYRTEISFSTNLISIHDQSEMFHFNFRPMRDVLFRLATNEMCFISIRDQWDTFYFDTRPIRDVLFRLLTNQGCFISISDQWETLYLDARPMRCFISIRNQWKMFYFDSRTDYHYWTLHRSCYVFNGVRVVLLLVFCSFPLSLCYLQIYYNICMGRRARDRIVVGFSTTCVISAYHH